MKKHIIHILIIIGLPIVLGNINTYADNGDIKLQIDQGSSCCVYGQNLDLGKKGVEFSNYTFTGNFISSIGTPRWTCSDMFGIETGWDLNILLSKQPTSEAGNIIPTGNVKLSYGASSLVGGNCIPVILSGTNIPMNGIISLLAKDGNFSSNYGRICAIQTPFVDMKVDINSGQAPGIYIGELTITLPYFMGTCDSNQVLQGTFYDSAVEGLSYSGNMGSSGTTTSGGYFNYKLGEKVTFSIGTVELGTVFPEWQRRVFLPEVFGLSRTNLTDNNVIKTAKLLQGLDQDNNPDNGININAASTSQITGSLSGINVDSKLSQLGKTIRTNLEVIEHLKTTLNSGFQETGEINYGWVKGIGGTGNDISQKIITDNSGNLYIIGYFSQTVNFGGIIQSSSGGSNDGFITKLNSSGNVLRVKTIGGVGTDSVLSATTDGSQNIYIVGIFNNTAITNYKAQFGNTILTSNTISSFIGQLDINGNWIKVEKIGSGAISTYGITRDLSENIYINGTFTNTITLGSTNFTSSGADDGFITKLDKNWNILRNKKVGGTSADRLYSDPSIDTNGYIYIGGHFQGTTNIVGSGNITSSGGFDVFIAKLNNNGNLVWVKKGGGIDNDIFKSVTNISGNVYINGHFGPSLTSFGGTSISGSGSSDIFISKLDSNGNWLWTKKGGGISVDQVTSPIIINNNDIYIGISGGTGTYGNNIVNNFGGIDAILAKLDTNGNWLGAWKWGSGGDEILYGVPTGVGNLYIGGTYNKDTKLDNTILINKGSTDIFIKKVEEWELY